MLSPNIIRSFSADIGVCVPSAGMMSTSTFGASIS